MIRWKFSYNTISYNTERINRVYIPPNYWNLFSHRLLLLILQIFFFLPTKIIIIKNNIIIYIHCRYKEKNKNTHTQNKKHHKNFLLDFTFMIFKINTIRQEICYSIRMFFFFATITFWKKLPIFSLLRKLLFWIKYSFFPYLSRSFFFYSRNHPTERKREVIPLSLYIFSTTLDTPLFLTK